MATWPGTLPAFTDFLRDSYIETPPDNLIRTDMDTGPAKIRKRFSAAPEIVQGDLYLTSSEVTAFRTFFDSTINEGADEFDSVHPRTGSAISARFVGIPQISVNGAGWNLSMTIEILP